MLVATMRFDLRIPGCGSLKEKRHVLKALQASIRKSFNVSVAEVDHQDLWQRTTVAVSAVGSETYHLRRVMSEVEKHVEGWHGVEVLRAGIALQGPDD